MLKLCALALAGTLLAGEAAAWQGSETAVPARAKANLTSLFSDRDYPAAAVAAGEQGTVGFALEVGANGRVATCTVTQSSGSAQLDDTTCLLIRSRARFTPALDADGATVPDTIAGKIVWKLPGPPPAPAP
jgi:protein TonB